jgi:hypothetical protein
VKIVAAPVRVNEGNAHVEEQQRLLRGVSGVRGSLM